MVLATIIRLEMAYPGVGILAGDNSQYLSVVTAHGVIMVFFMAMPLLFGFLGNFLLPTQMGVHDVAFPRMNSAAFWFLPASLLALCQLVCVDRRYQRMNCFNVRELQSLLRNKFIDDLNINYLLNLNINSNLKYKLNKQSNLNSPELNNTLNSTLYNTSNLFNQKLNLFTIYFQSTKQQWTNLNINYIYKFFNLEISLFFQILWKIQYLITTIYLFFFSFFYLNYNFFLITNTKNFKTYFYNYQFSNLTFSMNSNFFNFFNYIINENTFPLINDFRLNLLASPKLIYKIKIGNYLPTDLYNINFNFLFTSLNSKTVLDISLDWFSSTIVTSILVNSIYNSKKINNFNFELNKLSSLNILTNLSIHNSSLIFSSLFSSQSKQIRVLNDWRSLELQREGWRCRMLAARHQKSIFRRYINENELIWVVEKNAKDLLPGWAMITPFSSRTRYTLIGKTDIGILIVAITLIASMISSANFLMTYRYLSTLNNRKMRDARSFFSESVIAASWMMIAANPMLILGLLMLISDRHWKTSFFDYSGGGDTILFQHMFWFFGHPEVYVIIIPCFGVTNTLLSFYLRKRISARASLLYSLYTIAFLGFFVWGHHMYMVGLSHTTRMLYSTLTVMISVPAATKLMHWLVTFVNSSVHFELPFILNLLFIFYFVSGGISGMAVAHTGMDVLFHDTFYVIGHFHVMLAGSLMFSAYAAFYFYLPALFGVRYTRAFAYLHVFYYSIGQIFTVIPMIWLGYLGMPRRVLDYPSAMGGWHSLISSAHMITVSGILAFVIMLFDSLRKQKSYIIKTFGVGRYNTRLNFYFYQLARNRYWLSKHFTLLPVRALWHIKSKSQVINLEYAESVLFYYSFNQTKKTNKNSEWLYI